MLSDEGQEDRAVCLKYATALRNNLEKLKQNIIRDKEHYKMTSSKLGKLNNYALQRYNTIQQNIFVNGDASYFEILGQLSRYMKQAKADASEKYDTEHIDTAGKRQEVNSQWRGPIVMGLTSFCAVLHHRCRFVEQRDSALDCAEAFPYGRVYEEDGMSHIGCRYGYIRHFDYDLPRVYVSQFLLNGF